MALSHVFEKLGRAIFESPFESRRLAGDAPEVAEIRLAAIDAIKDKSHRVSGAHVFPFDLVRIHLLGIPDEQASVFRSEFLVNYFGEELKAALKRSNYRFSRDLRVEFTTTSRLPANGETWITVETLTRAAEQPQTAPGEHSPATLTVLQGAANQSQFTLDKPRINIGRGIEVFRNAGPSRRNDIAFLSDDPHGKSVSREHAHILRSLATNEYRIFNDRFYEREESCGIWIVREGLSFAVHRSPRGTVLRSGDEIHLGTAVVRFSLATVEAAPE
jgi:hypothetical protein